MKKALMFAAVAAMVDVSQNDPFWITLSFLYFLHRPKWHHTSTICSSRTTLISTDSTNNPLSIKELLHLPWLLTALSRHTLTEARRDSKVAMMASKISKYQLRHTMKRCSSASLTELPDHSTMTAVVASSVPFALLSPSSPTLTSTIQEISASSLFRPILSLRLLTPSTLSATSAIWSPSSRIWLTTKTTSSTSFLSLVSVAPSSTRFQTFTAASRKVRRMNVVSTLVSAVARCSPPS